MIPNGTEDIGGLVVPEKVTEEVVQQLEPELRKSKRNRTPKDFGPEIQLYLIKGTRDEVSDQHSYFFNVEDDPKIFNEAIKSQDVAFWKEAISDEMDYIMGNNTWVLVDLPPDSRRHSYSNAIKSLDEVVFSSGYLLNQANKYVYSKFDEAGKGVIICLYIDDMLIFGTDQVQVDLTKEFLSSRFCMKDMGEADVIPME
ncbi:zinc finger, CCHC-type containing protein [Tanacetum coccineum]